MNEIDEQRCVQEHFAQLRQVPCCSKAVFVVFVENNFGGASTAGRIMSYTAEYQPVRRVNEVFNKPGVRTTDINKVRHMDTLRFISSATCVCRRRPCRLASPSCKPAASASRVNLPAAI